MEGHQIEGCQPPTSFRPPERQKQDGTVQLVSQPTAAVSRTGPGLCWVAGLRGGAEYWSRCQDWRRPLSQTAQDGGTGNRLRCSEKLGSSLDCRLKCATNPGPRPSNRRMEARQQGGDLAHSDTLGGQDRPGGDGTGPVSCLVLLDG